MGQLDRATLDKLEQGVEGRLIEEDRPCAECGYNLKGLKMGGTCPECGTPIRVARTRREPEMGDSPSGYLTQLAMGTTLLGVGGIGWVIWLIVAPVLRVFAGIVIPIPWFVVPLIGVVWFAGTLLVVRERPFARARREQKGGAREWWKLRLTVAATQAFSLGIGVAYWMVVRGSAWWAIPLGVCLLVMMVGWAPLAVFLGRMAYWTGDDETGRRFHAMGWWLGMAGAVGAFIAAPAIGALVFMRWLGVLGMIVFLIVAFMMMVRVQEMGTTIRWAQRNAASARARDRRMAAKARAEAEREEKARQARLAAGLAAGGGVEMSEEQRRLLEEIERKHAAMEEAGEGSEQEQDRARPAPGRQQMVERGEGGEVFGLEGEEGEGEGRGGGASR